MQRVQGTEVQGCRAHECRGCRWLRGAESAGGAEDSGLQGVQGTRVQSSGCRGCRECMVQRCRHAGLPECREVRQCRGAGLLSAKRSESEVFRGVKSREGTMVEGSGMQGVQGIRVQVSGVQRVQGVQKVQGTEVQDAELTGAGR